MECNNRAWQLSTQTRTPAEDQEMLNVAHTAAHHWGTLGLELNDMRARMLLAEVHALLGLGATALSLANEVRSFFANQETDDWELAFVHVIHAHAAASANDTDQHKQSYSAAVKALEAIADEEDRKIVLQTFQNVPKP